jgi:fatty acid-binding protein DegV
LFSILCAPEHNALSHSGFLDFSQASAGDHLGIFPVFSFEDGCLIPLEKFRNMHAVMEYMVEFLDEFDHLKEIYLMSSDEMPETEKRFLQEFIHEKFNGVLLQDFPMNPLTASIFGPHCFYLTLLDI